MESNSFQPPGTAPHTPAFLVKLFELCLDLLELIDSEALELLMINFLGEHRRLSLEEGLELLEADAHVIDARRCVPMCRLYNTVFNIMKVCLRVVCPK